MADNDNDDNETVDEPVEIDLDDLNDEMRDKLLQHPEVRRFLEYEETSIPQIVSMLRNLQDGNEATYNLLVEGIASRSGRVTESTVKKVLSGFVEEYEEVSG